MLVRLNKYLSECGVASRRKAEEYIDQARVTVNGNIVMDLGFRVDPDKDKILKKVLLYSPNPLNKGP